MDNFFEKNKIFLAIIIGAVIIGGCVYLSAQVLSHKNWADFGSNSNSLQNFAPQNLGGQAAQNSSADAGLLQKCGASDNTIVTKVIDGDTIVVEGGYHIRLLGMDADEKGYPCYEPAKTRLEDLVLSKQVRLEKDKTDLDQYGRCLRYIFLGNTNVDVQLVKEGLAIARFYEPDVKYKAEITAAEKYAQEGKIGCKWANSQIINN